MRRPKVDPLNHRASSTSSNLWQARRGQRRRNTQSGDRSRNGNLIGNQAFVEIDKRRDKQQRYQKRMRPKPDLGVAVPLRHHGQVTRVESQ